MASSSRPLYSRILLQIDREKRSDLFVAGYSPMMHAIAYFPIMSSLLRRPCAYASLLNIDEDLTESTRVMGNADL